MQPPIPSPPPAWSLRPAEIGTLGLVGSGRGAERIRLVLPDNWTVVGLEGPEFLEVDLERCNLVCMMTEDSEDPARKEFLRQVNRSASDARVPVVLFASNIAPSTILGLHDLRAARLIVEGIDDQGLPQVLREAAIRPLFEHLQLRITDRFSDSMLASVLRTVVGQVPRTAPTAVEAIDKDRIVFYRQIQDLPGLVGFARSTIEQFAHDAGIVLSDVIRMNTLLHGMALYVPGESRETAFRLGYETAEAWRAAVRRALRRRVPEDDPDGRSLRSAAARPLGTYGDWLLATLGA